MADTVWVRGADVQMVDFGGAVELMDDDIREELHSKASGWTEQEFMDAYCEAHERKYGCPFCGA